MSEWNPPLMFGRALTYLLLVGAVAAAPAQADTFWSPAGQLAGTRYQAVAAALHDGRVLVAGGAANSGPAFADTVLWNPQTNQFTATASLSHARREAVALTLKDGRVLVAGGNTDTYGQDTVLVAELYDPTTRTWSSAGTMQGPHREPAAVELADGRVLVVGGEHASSVPEIWDPTTNEWTQTGPASTVRWLPALARLKDGRVLAAGGWDGQYLASAELYDPDTDEWTDTTPLGEARSGAGAAVLPDGRVLVAGGGGFVYTPKVYPFQSRRAELFDPATEQWTRTGDLTIPRPEATSMVTLADGRPAIVGGFWWKNIDPSVPVWSGDTYERTAEVYDAAHGTWILTPPMSVGRAGHVVVPLADGGVFVAGGFDAGTLAERIVPGLVSEPTPTPTPVPTATATPTANPQPTASPTPTPIAGPPPGDPEPGTLAFAKLPARLRATHTLTIALRCNGGTCRDTLVLKHGRSVLAEGTVSARAGRTVTVKLKLSGTTRRLLRKRPARVTLELTRQHLRATRSLRA